MNFVMDGVKIGKLGNMGNQMIPKPKKKKETSSRRDIMEVSHQRLCKAP